MSQQEETEQVLAMLADSDDDDDDQDLWTCSTVLDRTTTKNISSRSAGSTKELTADAVKENTRSPHVEAAGTEIKKMEYSEEELQAKGVAECNCWLCVVLVHLEQF